VPEYTQDMLSALYYVRCLDFTNMKVGSQYDITMFLDEEVWVLRIKYLGKEVVKVKAGKFNCLKFRPLIQEGRVFKEEEDLTLWLTDDKNHIPVRLEANVLIGSIKIDLKKFDGIRHALIKVK